MIEVKDYILLTESVKYLRVKIHTNLVGNILLRMSPLNSTEPKFSSSKEKNVLVLLKYQDIFI